MTIKRHGRFAFEIGAFVLAASSLVSAEASISVPAWNSDYNPPVIDAGISAVPGQRWVITATGVISLSDYAPPSPMSVLINAAGVLVEDTTGFSREVNGSFPLLLAGTAAPSAAEVIAHGGCAPCGGLDPVPSANAPAGALLFGKVVPGLTRLENAIQVFTSATGAGPFSTVVTADFSGGVGMQVNDWFAFNNLGSFAVEIAPFATVGVGTVAAHPGESAVVPVSLSTDQPLTVLSVDLSFDQALCTMLQNQSITRAGRTAVDPAEGGVGCPDAGRTTVALFDLGGGVVIPPGEGVIAQWAFDVRPDAPDRTFLLTVAVDQASNGPAPVPLSRSNGRLTVRACFLDSDGDRVFSFATDLIYIARHILGLPPVPSSFRAIDPTIPSDTAIAASIDTVAAELDVDHDGEVEVATDVVYIARHFLGLSPVPPSFRLGDPTIPADSVIGAEINGLCP
jgi:hypothetical protein